MNSVTIFCPTCGGAVTFPLPLACVQRHSRSYLMVEFKKEQVYHSCPDPTRDEIDTPVTGINLW